MKETTASVETADKRRLRALQIAEECTTLLKEQFGARRVVLFGSLVGQGVWHDRSDIDLAVEGIPDEDFFKAYTACHKLLPSDLEVDLDLVPLESAYPEMRARILREVEMPDDPILALQDLVDDELVALTRVAKKTAELLNEASQPPSWVELYAMAGMSHEFYTGIERIFERIAVSLGEGLPRGAFWHVDLLTQMATEQVGNRPAVIDEPLHGYLQEYLKFRHFFRHAYGYTLAWSKLRWKAEHMGKTLEMLQEQLKTFFDKLGE